MIDLDVITWYCESISRLTKDLDKVIKKGDKENALIFTTLINRMACNMIKKKQKGKIEYMNKKVFSPLGVGTHKRELNDFYATEKKAVEALLGVEGFNINILDAGVGTGCIADVFTENGYNVKGIDIVDRGWKGMDFELTDFLKYDKRWNGDIVMNPPYSHALEFVEKALTLINDGSSVSALLRIQFLEGKRRRKFFNLNPPKTIYVFSGRINCARGGRFDDFKSNSAVCYAWFIWEKGFTGSPTIKWI